MARLVITEENKPTPEEFRRMLAETMARSNPLDELLELALELREYEQKYGLSSPEFYARYQRGEMGDSAEVMDWAMAYDSFRYDNAPHFPDLPGFPDHKHTPQGVEPAEPPDLSDVLREVDEHLYREVN